jgi:HK97 family phage prohead protease
MDKVFQFLQTYTHIAKGEHTPEEVDMVFEDLWPRLVPLVKENESVSKVVANYEQYQSKVLALDQFAHEVHSHTPTLLGEVYGVNPFLAKDVSAPVLNSLALDSDFQLLSRSYASTAMTDGVVQLDGTIIAGYASVAIIDKEDHLIPLSVLKTAFEGFMARGEEYRAIQYAHSNMRIGTCLESWTSPTTGRQYVSGVDEVGLYIVCRLRADTTFSKQIVQRVHEGSLHSFSVFGLSHGFPQEKIRGDKTYYEVNDFELEEITICEEGMNPGARFSVVKSANAIKLNKVVAAFNRPVNLGLEVGVSSTVSLPTGIEDNWLRKALSLRLYRFGIKGKFSLALQPELNRGVFVMKGGGYRLSDYSVALVGGVVSKGFSFHDVDILIRAPKGSMIGYAIKRAVVSILPKDIRSKARFIFDDRGPHGDYLPLYSLRAVRIPEDE